MNAFYIKKLERDLNKLHNNLENYKNIISILIDKNDGKIEIDYDELHSYNLNNEFKIIEDEKHQKIIFER